LISRAVVQKDVRHHARRVRKVISSRVRAAKKDAKTVLVVLKVVRKADKKAVPRVVMNPAHHVQKAAMIANKSVVQASASALS